MINTKIIYEKNNNVIYMQIEFVHEVVLYMPPMEWRKLKQNYNECHFNFLFLIFDHFSLLAMCVCVFFCL